MPHSVETLLADFASKKNSRSNFEKIWKDVDEFLFGFIGNYDGSPLTGQISYENVYNQTPRIFHTDATNALVGILWQQGGRSIKITRADNIDESAEVNDWFEKANKDFIQVLDDPNARFTTTLQQYMDDALARGSSGVGVYRGTRAPLIFKNHAQRFVYYEENEDGWVDNIALRSWLPAITVLQKYGEDHVSPAVLKLARSPSQSQTEVEIVQFIKPNEGEDAAERPFLSIHLDIPNKHIMRDSFFEDLPIKIGRIAKNNFEVYARCPAMDVIQTIKRLNSITGDTHIGVQRAVAPAFGVLAQPVGGGVIDLTADAPNQFNMEGIEGTNPVFPLQVVGDLSAGVGLIENMERDISNAYFINKLIDLNNDTEITATEALILDRIRNTSLGSLLSRQINELITPTLETSFGILFNDNFFGFLEGDAELERAELEASLKGEVFAPKFIPKAIQDAYQNNEPIFKVEYLTPAARLLQSEEVNNIVEATRITLEMAGADPTLLDNIDGDKTVRNVWELKGLSDKLKNPEDVDELRKQRQALQEKQLELQQQQQAADIEATGGEQGAV